MYVAHEGTIKIAGGTVPHRAAGCAEAYLKRKLQIIDFLCIGAGPNQQAMKAMTIFRFRVERDSQDKLSLAFRPLAFRVHTNGQGSELPKDKGCTVWRTVVIDHPDARPNEDRNS